MNRPDLSLLNVLKTPAEWRQWIEEDPIDPPSISNKLSELMIEFISCYRFINWKLEEQTFEQLQQRDSLTRHINDIRQQIIELCGGIETRATLDVDEDLSCVVRVFFDENKEFRHSAEWAISVHFARRLKHLRNSNTHADPQE
jgi:hypothetical protein